MKLFKNVIRKEGDACVEFPLIVYGKCFCTTTTITRLSDGTALDNDNMPDGWYLCINLPFVKNRKYVSVRTFDIMEGLCKPKLMIRIRKIGHNKYYSLSKYFTWKPIHEEITNEEVRYDDSYLSAIKTFDIIKGK